MANINEVSGPRALVQICGVILALCSGAAVLPLIPAMIFSAWSAWDALGIFSLLAIIPLSVMALFKPRLAASGLLASWAVNAAGVLFDVFRSATGRLSFPGVALLVLLPAAGALLLYGSLRSGAGRAGSGSPVGRDKPV